MALLAVLARSVAKVGDDLFDISAPILAKHQRLWTCTLQDPPPCPKAQSFCHNVYLPENARLAIGCGTLLVQPPDLLERDPRQFEWNATCCPRVFTFLHKAII